MSNFTAADVKKLRDLTGSGMMDCKKALEESAGDFDKAVEILRIKGAKDVGKRAGRTTANGLVAHAGASLLELNCETDFVAKNADFIELAQNLVTLVDDTKPADVEALLAAKLGDGRTVAETIEAASAKIGEKLVVNRFAALDGPVAVYMHRKSPDLPPQVGVAVVYRGTSDEAAESDARGIAMQIAAMRPKYVTRDEVPDDVVATERRIAEETAREEGKPEAALPKIVEGRVNGFFKDFVLIEQPSVSDQKKTVKQVLAEAGIEVTRFVRFEVGQA
jgi:elongation factor Ts